MNLPSGKWILGLGTSLAISRPSMRKLMLENMSFRWLWAVAVLALMVSATVILTPEPVSAGAPLVVIVDDDGKAVVGNCNSPMAADATTITAGLAAIAGHADSTVWVCPGTYVEEIDITEAGMFLLGITKANKQPVVDGGSDNSGPVITVSGGGVTVDNFWVRNAGIPGDACRANPGIRVSSDGNFITNNTVTGNCCGIILTDADNNTVEDNTVNSNQSDGIRLWKESDNNTVRFNNVANNKDGIELGTEDDKVDSGNTIQENHIHTNTENGIVLKEFAPGNFVLENNVHNNGDDGIEIQGGATGNTVTDNDSDSNGGDGIAFRDGATGAIDVEGNDASKNGVDGIFDFAGQNAITETDNTFFKNGDDACDGCV